MALFEKHASLLKLVHQNDHKDLVLFGSKEGNHRSASRIHITLSSRYDPHYAKLIPGSLGVDDFIKHGFEATSLPTPNTSVHQVIEKLCQSSSKNKDKFSY